MCMALPSTSGTDAREVPCRERLIALCARMRHRSIARDHPVQPSLVRLLNRFGVAVLAPVIDSLCYTFEQALQRSMQTGKGHGRSADERMLYGLISGERPATCLACPASSAELLQCALCSTRIMLALALPARSGVAA